MTTTNPVEPAFEAVCTKLREELRRMIKHPIPNPKNGVAPAHSGFCPPGATWTVFDQQRSYVADLYIHAKAERTSSDQADKVVQQFVEAIIGERDGDARSNILAILISSHCYGSGEAWSRFENLCLNQDGDCNLRDGDLPIDKPWISKIFGEDQNVTNDFYDGQFLYCPIVFHSKKLVVYRDHRQYCRLPFMEKADLGEGAHSTVYAVKISAGHFKGVHDSQDVWYAQKDFNVGHDSRIQQREEWDLANGLIEATYHTGHPTINFVLAALDHGPSFSLIYEMAACDLWIYMQEKGQHPSTSSDPFKEMKRVLRQTIGIADGLRFLHDELRHPERGRFTCFHLDLKPQNILVYNLRNPNQDQDNHGLREIFKITDFSIAGIIWKEKLGGSTKEPKEESPIILNRLFSSRTSSTGAPTSTPIQQRSIPNQLGDNCDCIAPEAMMERNKVSSAADVWSFGCVLTMVLAWLLGDSKELLHLQAEREKDGNRSWFFKKSEPKTKRIDKFDLLEVPVAAATSRIVFILSPGVEKWYMKACSQKDNKLLAELCKRIWKLLRPEHRGPPLRGVLIPNPVHRLVMDEVYKKLDMIHEKWVQEPYVGPSNTSQPQSSTESLPTSSTAGESVKESRSSRTRILKPFRKAFTRDSSTPSSSFTLVLRTSKDSKEAKTCSIKAHVDGSIHLVYCFEKHIQTFYLPRKGTTSEPPRSNERELSCPQGQSWSNFVIGETVLCAVSSRKDPTISYLHFQALPNDKQQATVLGIHKYDNTWISKLAISAKESTLAYAVSTFPGSVIHVKELHGLGDVGLLEDPEDSASVTLATMGDISREGDILDLRFSSDGKFLYAIESDVSTRATVYLNTIEVGSVKLTQRRPFDGENTNGWTHPLFTALAPFEGNPKCLILLSRCRVIVYDRRTLGETRDNDASNNLVAILPLRSTRFIALHAEKSCLRIFQANPNQTPLVELVQLDTKTSCKTKVISDFEVGKDCASIVWREATSSKLLIARVTGIVEVLTLPMGTEDVE